MGSHTILCIDDNETALKVRKLLLESAGYTVITARNGVEALAIFKSGRPVDLVLSDHFLQGQTGAQITAEMKRLKPEVPVAIISGALETPEGIQHADLFLTKTGTPSELLEALARLLCSSEEAASGAAGG